MYENSLWSDLTKLKVQSVMQILALEPIPLVEPIPPWIRLQLRLFFAMESVAPIPP